ncbi:hypothetical protein CDAR_56151 [Caerostris darwini]|uniref:Uncharacterized protein n=1 Tax=Caerostris darwini TaxID=1538125 RepID=A0AAV4RNA6_9ARAC|nr:hypothetical protein CDAR_56151 [Caerostris darwini]
MKFLQLLSSFRFPSKTSSTESRTRIVHHLNGFFPSPLIGGSSFVGGVRIHVFVQHRSLSRNQSVRGESRHNRLCPSNRQLPCAGDVSVPANLTDRLEQYGTLNHCWTVFNC